MERQRRVYLAFMVRLWRAGDPPDQGQTSNWRASLENPYTGERLGFGSLAELFTFLLEEVMRCEAACPPPIDDTKECSERS